MVHLWLLQICDGLRCLLLVGGVSEQILVYTVAGRKVLRNLDVVDDERIVVLCCEHHDVRLLSVGKIHIERAPLVRCDVQAYALARALRVDDELIVLNHRTSRNLHMETSLVVRERKHRCEEFARNVIVSHACADEAAVSISAPDALPSCAIGHIRSQCDVVGVLERHRLLDGNACIGNFREVLVEHHERLFLFRSHVSVVVGNLIIRRLGHRLPVSRIAVVAGIGSRLYDGSGKSVSLYS